MLHIMYMWLNGRPNLDFKHMARLDMIKIAILLSGVVTILYTVQGQEGEG